MPYSREETTAFLEQTNEKRISWYSTAKANFADKTTPQIIGALHEFLEKNLVYIENMRKTHTLLRDLETRPEVQLAPQQALIYSRYLLAIERTILSFQDLNLIGAYWDEHSSKFLPPNEVLINLVQKTGALKEFVKQVTTLAHLQLPMNDLYRDHVQEWKPIERELGKEFSTYIDLSALFTLSVQHIPRLPLMAKEIAKRFSNTTNEVESYATDFLKQTEAFSEQFNTEAGILQKIRLDVEQAKHAIKHDHKPAPIILSKAILKFNLNNPQVDELTNRLQLLGFDAHLRDLLNSASLPTNEIINSALGINYGEGISSYDPKNFNAKKLQELFEQTKNPAWLALKTLIPVSEHFSTLEKIQAYIDMAAQYAAKALDKKGKYLGAYEMAKAAYAIAEQEPTPEVIGLAKRAFCPQDGKQNVKNGQFGNWIVAKSRKHHDEIVSIAFLNGAELDAALAAYMNKTSRIAGDSSIDVALDNWVTTNSPTRQVEKSPADSGFEQEVMFPTIGENSWLEPDKSAGQSSSSLRVHNPTPEHTHSDDEEPLTAHLNGPSQAATLSTHGVFKLTIEPLKHPLLIDLKRQLYSFDKAEDIYLFVSDFKLSKEHTLLAQELRPKQIEQALKSLVHDALLRIESNPYWSNV